MAITAGFALGMLALIAGADWLVQGAVRISQRLCISPVVIGLTVVAFGTNAPELAVTMQAARSGSPDIAIGNIIGSNIQNLLLVLGFSALFVSLRVSRRIVLIDLPLLLVLSLALLAMASDGQISTTDGLLLLGTLAAYTWLSIRHGRTSPDAASVVVDTERDQTGSTRVTAISIAKVAAGLLLLSFGGEVFVRSASELARRLGMSELTVGITVVAFGTSLPEIVTCVLAAVRGHRELAVGNVVGSNLFNILCVLGITSSTVPGGLPLSPTVAAFDLPLMVAITVLVYAVCVTGNRVVRGEGLLLLAIFVSYVGWLTATTSGVSSVAQPCAIAGLSLTALLVGFQVYGMKLQRWLPVPEK